MIYTTKNTSAEFNWNQYFNNLNKGKIPNSNIEMYFNNVRQLLTENPQLLSLVLGNILRNLLKGVQVTHQPRILELGAGTGFLTRLIMTFYGGSGVLVDNCEASFGAYKQIKDKDESNITYLLEDLFRLELTEKFDFVCSLGLIEHFKEKNEILSIHKKYLNKDGKIIVIFPMDSYLTRAYYEVHPELNLGYRELLTKKYALDQIQSAGLEPINVQVSHGYVYDMMTVLCK